MSWGIWIDPYAGYVDIGFARKEFLAIYYTSILEEIGVGLSHGTIVRRLIREGEKLDSAEKLYNYIFSNQKTVKELVSKMNADLSQTRSDYLIHRAKMLNESPPVKRELIRHEMMSDQAAEKYVKAMMHTGFDILLHLIGACLGVQI